MSVLDGAGVIVTRFIDGGRPTDADGRLRSTAVQRELGSLLGRLHTLPAAGGHLPEMVGRRNMTAAASSDDHDRT